MEDEETASEFKITQDRIPAMDIVKGNDKNYCLLLSGVSQALC